MPGHLVLHLPNNPPHHRIPKNPRLRLPHPETFPYVHLRRNFHTHHHHHRPSILIRATDGNTNAPNPKSKTNSQPQQGKAKPTPKAKPSKVKLSTVVSPDELEAFYLRYAEVCKAGMTGLKKRDRKKGKAKGKGGVAKA
ncbi:hypothetical protein BO70DRAFT_425864 [Aspergillus heteromorphus CBS 117.55]|uniref:Signal recognition particle subunit SRP14 n=1 Tax=Aspergillus heteromorphus CBS 117.55 TaxID=1448321 RepID=A0A317X1T5_9EURO|nr:uncharacterized protein BO70DRAFT_425864 [Aspergillus heteromorphus CBS 117.55]PWY90938.1 hypothetical protein BO70DRAFT_425864 [Aspergillus heteromorphus CBS 117.55]